MNKRSVLLATLLAAAAGSATAEDIALCLQGVTAMQSRDYARAITLYDACVATGSLSTPTLARTYRNYAIAYRSMGQPGKAIEWSSRALALQPADAWSDYVNRGNAYSDAGRLDEALADYASAAALQPQSGDVHYNRGIVYERQNALEKARAEYLEAYRKGLRTQLLRDRMVALEALPMAATPAAPAAPPALVLADALRTVYRVTRQSCQSFSATEFARHPDEAAMQATKFVPLQPVGLQFGVPRLLDLPLPVVKVYLGDRARGLVDHYVLLSEHDLGPTVAAVVVSEVPAQLDTPQKLLAAAGNAQRELARRAGAALETRRLQGPYGEALEVVSEQRVGSACFPTSDYVLATAGTAARTVGISRFVAVQGKLVEFALVDRSPEGQAGEEAVRHARRVMDGFWLGLRPL